MSEAPLVSVLFITYKRVHLLRRTLETFLANTSYPNLQLVVTDDGSPASMQRELSQLPFHKHVFSKRRRGLGANVNEGLRHCDGDYILLLQDDWQCCGPHSYLADSVNVMQQYPMIGLVRFYGVDTAVNSSHEISSLPISCRALDVPDRPSDFNQFLYSDTPHLRSRALNTQLGPYRADMTMEDCEKEFGDRFLKQDQFSAVFFPDYNNRVFVHIGESESFRTNSLRHRLESTISTVTQPYRGNGLFELGKRAYRSSVRLMAKLRVIR